MRCRARGGPGGAVVGRRPGRRGGAGSNRCDHRDRAQRARGGARRDRARRGAGAAPCGRGGRLVAADRLHAGGDARAVRHVRRCRRPGPGRPAGVRRVGPEGRCGRFGVGSGARPPAQPSTRGHRRACSRRNARRYCRSSSSIDVPRPAPSRPPSERGSVAPNRACPSGRLARGGVSERPKEHASKACEVQASVGSNPTATADPHRHRQFAAGPCVASRAPMGHESTAEVIRSAHPSQECAGRCAFRVPPPRPRDRGRPERGSAARQAPDGRAAENRGTS